MTHSGLDRMLAAWLPEQRWFAGGQAAAREIEIRSDVRLADGDPELRHLIVDAGAGRDLVSYQVLVGAAAAVPPELARARIGELADGRIAYDGAADPRLAAVLLSGIAGGRTAGPIRFTAQPGAVIDASAAGRMLPALASNTSVVFGDQAILKLLRRPQQGDHPDFEIPAALAAGGSKLVAPPLGRIEMSAGAGEPVLLGILSEFFPHASDGWSLALANLHAPSPDFAGQARLLGETTARMHAELAAAFGTSVLSGAELAEFAQQLAAELTQAVAVVPQVGEYEAAIGSCYAELTEPGQRVRTQRVHGDYHLGQVLSASGGWVVLDFEGEPSVPLDRRRAFGPAQRDVAGMLRSFDYAARHQVLAQPASSSLSSAAARWASSCQQAFCDGYADVSGADPRGTGPLLRALTYSKAVYEAVYEVRHRPDWLPIPLAALAEANR